MTPYRQIKEKVLCFNTLPSASPAAGSFVCVCAKVNTEGQSVADVFYVADENGNKVHDQERLKRLQRVLYDRILALHARAESA